MGDIIRHIASTALHWAPLLSLILTALALLWRVSKRAAKKADAEPSARPYFMFEEYPKSRTWRQADGRLGVRVTLKNVKDHPAANMLLRVGLVDCKLDRQPLYEWRAKCAQVSPSGEVPWEESGVSFARQMPPHFLFTKTCYEDPTTRQTYHQLFVRLWQGISEGNAYEVFKPASGEEEARVRQFLKIAL